MSVRAKTNKYTPEQYLALEEKAEYRSEYWNVVNIADGVIKNLGTAHRLGICEQMHEKESSERHNSRYLMQFSHQKGFADFNRHLS